MKRHQLTLRAILRVLATVLVIAAAAVVWQFLPAPTQVFAPFDVHGISGAAVTGRAIEATVHGARVAPDVTSGSLGRTGKRIAAAGKWVVVDATVEAVRDSVTPKAELLVGGDTYRPSERFLTENLDAGGWLDPGIPHRGVWVFDVADDLLDENASRPIVLQVWVGDGRLDSRLVIAIDKHDVRRQDVVALQRPKVGG